VYAFPAAIYYRLIHRVVPGPAAKSRQQQQSVIRLGRAWTSVAPLTCLAFGLLMCVTGTTSIVLQKLGVVNLQSAGHK
jgi:hypothetical protein